MREGERERVIVKERDLRFCQKRLFRRRKWGLLPLIEDGSLSMRNVK